MKETMVAKHANWPRVADPIFNISERAQKAIKDFGKDNVINATIGALTDDDGDIITLNTVFDEYKSLPNSEIASYASIAGQKDYLEAVKKACFKDSMPNAHIRAVASPGGSGVIKLAVWNYTNEGDEIMFDPIDGSPPGSAVPGILQARTLEWVAIYSSRNNKNTFNNKNKILV